MMIKNRKYIILIASIFFGINLFGQNTGELMSGNVSFISSQNVYVQFANTDGIHIGDTLFAQKNNILQPVLVVKSMSTISCVGASFPGVALAVTNQIVARKKIESQPIEVIVQKSKEAISINDQAIAAATKKEKTSNPIADFDGRASLSSYINNTSDTTLNSILRFNLSLNAHHIGNSKLSAECYMTLTNKNTYTPITQTVTDTTTNESTNTLVNRANPSSTDLKIYNLALRYDFDSTACLTLGRKINTNLANIGAVDGLQFERNGRNISFGAVVGSRPDQYSYGINTNLLQFGAFIGYRTKKENKTSQTSVALFNQMNNMLTDRRFVYIQHSNSLLKNLDFFGSMEVDLYGKVNNQLSTTLDLTSTYLSLNWRPAKKLSMSLSYDARKNVYYYETFKSYVDSLLDKETRQGFRFQTSYRLFKQVSWGGNAGFRLPSTNPSSNTTTSYSANGYTYLTFSQVPLIDASLTLDATALKTQYFTNALMYGGTLSKDFLDGKLFTELSYHYVDFTYISSAKLQQNIAELSLSWRIAKKLILSVDFEATQEIGGNLQGRAFLNLSQRF